MIHSHPTSQKLLESNISDITLLSDRINGTLRAVRGMVDEGDRIKNDVFDGYVGGEGEKGMFSGIGKGANAKNIIRGFLG